MLPFFIPFLFCRLCELYKRKAINLVLTAQEGTITSLFILSSLPKLIWLPLSFGLYIRWYGIHKYQADILTFLKSTQCFLDSIKATPVKRPICLCCVLSLISYSFIPNASPFWLAIFVISFFFSFYKPKRNSSLPILSFPHEISSLISPNYPALRKTHAFLGEKRFDVKLEKPNIIFIFLESFRAKNVGCLGAEIPRSPHFDKWAKKGMLFRNFHANGLQTFRAFLSAYFGIPAHLNTVSLKPFCSMSMVGLPQILKKNGYHNAVIQSGDLSFDHLYPFFKRHGFETIIGGEEIKGTRSSSWGVDDEYTVRYASKWLEKQIEPTFLSLFTISNHHPWKPPQGRFTKDPYQNYLQTFAYTDHCLNLFLENINFDNSIVFISGDHGQEINDRRPYSEITQSLYEENIHLPLLILGSSFVPKVFDCNASFVDFLPTILDLLQLNEVHHSVGKSLLRKVDIPTFFSMHREDLQIGALREKTKVILEKAYDLEKDPKEKKPVECKELSLECKKFFNDVDTITQANAWAPPNNLFSLRSTLDMSEHAWLTYAKDNPNVPVIDLSSGHLGDQAILNLTPSSWHQVNLRNSTRITDKSLQWMGKHCKKLTSLDLSHCHLITDSGVRHILLPSLRHLWLEGLDLEDFVPKNRSLNLRTCSLKDIPRLSSQSLLSIYKNSPDLIFWSATLANITNVDLVEMSLFKKQTTNMLLTDGIQILDDALSQLLNSQQELQEIHLENFPLIECPDFSKLTKLRYLKILDCPRFHRSSLDPLKKFPIMISLQK